MTVWKQAVARAFDGAEDYDRAARIQAVAAERLAAVIAQAPLSFRPRTLEIGCGTGLLTAALRARLALGPMLVTDIAPAMLARCRARLGPAPDIRFMAMDGERPCLAAGPDAGFDLIASSLAAQWFEDLPGALRQLAALLRPGGLLALATLAEGTFQEWDRARPEPTLAEPGYPDAGTLRRLRFENCASQIRLDRLRETHADGVSFLRALRVIGAHRPRAAATPLAPGALRRRLRAFEVQGAGVSYVIATLLIRREAPPDRDAIRDP